MPRIVIAVLLAALLAPTISCAERQTPPAGAGETGRALPEVLMAFKRASGGTRWDQVASMELTGTVSSGGLGGDYHATYDLLTGRSREAYQLGPVQGAEGYDGEAPWSQDPGGEIAVLNAPEAKRRARSQAWLNARAYWFPGRLSADFATLGRREQDGASYSVLVATPQDGDPVTLWFSPDSHLLARWQQRQGGDTVTSELSDYRDVGGLKVPFQIVTDVTDTAGRTDPRRRTTVHVEQVKTGVAVADADFAPPEMQATAHIDTPAGVTRIPFELINNHIYVHGEIDGKPARLLVDTGGVNLLTPAATARLGLTGSGQLAASGVGEQRVDLALARANSVRVGDAVLDQPVFYVVDLGRLADVEGVEFDGLVGYEMFRRFGVEIDYQRRILTLAEPDRFHPPAGATAVPFDLDNRIPIVSGTLDGVPVRLSVDTGSRASLTLHSPFARAHELTARYQAAPVAVSGWGVGGPMRSRPARVGELRLGNAHIDNLAADIFLGDKGSFADPDLSGNLGGGALHHFTVAFDYDAKQMYLAPNSEFGVPDPFDRSGLWLLAHDGVLEITDVADDSAAARAGLRAGDRITAIGGTLTSSQGLNEWRRRLRELPTGTRLALQIERDGHVESATLVLADRIPPTARAPQS